MRNKVELIEYLTDILTGDPAKFMEFMGYDDIGEDLVGAELNRMNDAELEGTIEDYSDDYENIEEFEENV